MIIVVFSLSARAILGMTFLPGSRLPFSISVI